MNEAVIIKNPDGSLLVAYPVISLEISLQKDIPQDPTSVFVVDRSSLPDKYFRNAWTWDGAVSVDMAKARVIHRENIQKATEAYIALVKAQIEKAEDLDDNQKVNELKNKKKLLRQTLESLDLSSLNTPETLKNFWPAGLVEAKPKKL